MWHNGQKKKREKEKERAVHPRVRKGDKTQPNPLATSLQTVGTTLGAGILERKKEETSILLKEQLFHLTLYRDLRRACLPSGGSSFLGLAP